MSLSIRLFIVFWCACFSAAAQDSLEVYRGFQKGSLFPLPIIYYTPETGWTGGISLFSTFKMPGQTKISRPSQAQIGFAYTQRRQVLFYLPFQLFPGKQRWQAYGEFGYYRYTYQFFGIGNNTQVADEENYDVNFPRFRANFLRLIRPHHYIGIRYWWDQYRIIRLTENGLLAQNTITGTEGGTLSGAGLMYNFDSRDDLFYPKRGMLAEIELFANQKIFGSAFNYQRLSADLAHYQSVSKKTVLATNLWLVHLAGDPPFQQLAFIGGPKKMRGFFEGRLRDKNLWMVQTELRRTLPRRFGWALFGGMGAVGPEWRSLGHQKVHFTYGAGMRFAISKKEHANLRFDLAGNEYGELAPYLTIKEAF